MRRTARATAANNAKGQAAALAECRDEIAPVSKPIASPASRTAEAGAKLSQGHRRAGVRGDLCHEAPTHAVTRISRSSATGSIDNSPGGFLLH
jgi:hypothetical protein